MITLEVTGIPEVLQRLAQLGEVLPRQLIQATHQEAEDILDASLPLVPVDTTLLILTGMVEKQADGADIRYGGHGLAPYATLQHFNTAYNHPNGGQAFFLQEPFFAATAGMLARLAAAVRG